MRRLIASSVSIALAAILGSAQADGPQALAEALFLEGKRLMAAGDYAQACPKLAESHRLDPGGGTVLTYALCLEKVGKTASAWAAFEESAAFAARQHDPDRAAVADAHLAALSPRLVRLLVHVGAPALDRLKVRLDGRELPPAAWDMPTPVDPGVHEIEASAPGAVPLRTARTLDREGTITTVDIPSLVPAPSASSSSTPHPARSAPQTADAPAPSLVVRRIPDAPATFDRPAFVLLLGGAAAAAVVGGALGYAALRGERDVRVRCPASPCSDAVAEQENATARARADASTGFFVLALLLGGASAYVGLAPTFDPSARRAAVRLNVSF